MRWVDGTKHSPLNDNRAVNSIPTSYTVYQDGSTFYAESNNPNGTDYTGVTANAVIASAQAAITRGFIWVKDIDPDTLAITPKAHVAILFDWNGGLFFGEGDGSDDMMILHRNGRRLEVSPLISLVDDFFIKRKGIDEPLGCVLGINGEGKVIFPRTVICTAGTTTGDSHYSVYQGQYWDGAATADCSIQLYLNQLTTGPTFQLLWKSYDKGVFQANLMALRENGDLHLMSGGLHFPSDDANLYRSLANQLTTDDQIRCVDGVVTYAKAGTISDADFTVSLNSGLIGIDTTNDRIYFKTAVTEDWHYCAKDAGFEINAEETECPICGKPIKINDFVAGQIDSLKSDGALHGLHVHLKCALKA